MLESGELRKSRGRFFLPSGAGSKKGKRKKRSLREDRELGMRMLCEEHGLQREFPEDLLKDAESIANREILLEGTREDLSHLPIIAIDPHDARDHDDAISLETLKDGTRRLGIHIADVSEYLPPNSRLDQEAKRRGNSTYFPFETIPMLPASLSGDTCSLKSGSAKYALTLFLDFDSRGRQSGSRLLESLLSIHRDYSYEEAEELLEGNSPDSALLRSMQELSSQLSEQREKEGALRFEMPETRVKEEGGKILGFEKKPLLQTHRLVEEFMLAANREVARIMQREKLPGLYRIHKRPDDEDVKELRHALSLAGIAWNPTLPPRPAEYRDLAKRIQEREDRVPLFFRLLRSLQKAKYSSSASLHFGLAWTDYLHFTSPIRRYADLQVHRSLKSWLRGQTNRKQGELKSLAEHLSETEILSLQAERDSMRLEMVLWARQHLGDVHEATVLGVREGGLIVQLPQSGAEGFLPASQLGGEWFHFEEDRELLRGEFSGKVFAAGDSLRLQIVAASLKTRRVHFFLVE
ncbi:MAG: ribonuclease R [Candidatus Krumholzibacteria bacterium]|nr:ribonuclease R [Candidatus Krumholzibacteria bacterium]MDP7020986.1 ribonuclease R [Candidatus Krumholzibacteria bacterium]